MSTITIPFDVSNKAKLSELIDDIYRLRNIFQSYDNGPDFYECGYDNGPDYYQCGFCSNESKKGVEIIHHKDCGGDFALSLLNSIMDNLD